MDMDAIIAEVAAAVGLAEGDAGIRDILAAVADDEPVPVREVSRRTELPVPIVSAACNELRRRGVIDHPRPVRFTSAGRAALAGIAASDGAAVGSGLGWHAACPTCAGRGIVIPAELAALADDLAEAASLAPAVRPELDQSHCTVATKIHRVLALHQANGLAGRRVLVLGDDDLVGVAIGAFAVRTGIVPRRLAVVDADPDVLEWSRRRLAGTPVAAELVRHDLREPLPAGLAGGFDAVLTDPPYTVAGAELFLSRAVAALAMRPGGLVMFSFGTRKPEEAIAVQRSITGMGLVIRSLTPGFNSYLGAGILAGTSHLYQLRAARDARPLIAGHYDGPLYTAEGRAVAARPYRCANCRTVWPVGPGERWPAITDLRRAGCPECGAGVFRPMPRVTR